MAVCFNQEILHQVQFLECFGDVVVRTKMFAMYYFSAGNVNYLLEQTYLQRFCALGYFENIKSVTPCYGLQF